MTDGHEAGDLGNLTYHVAGCFLIRGPLLMSGGGSGTVYMSLEDIFRT
jgi:hypothetical protein